MVCFGYTNHALFVSEVSIRRGGQGFTHYGLCNPKNQTPTLLQPPKKIGKKKSYKIIVTLFFDVARLGFEPKLF
jgi:hypothetical protein